MKISSLEKLLKNLFLIESNDKTLIDGKFEIGEILKGKILKQIGDILLVNVEKKGNFKALSKIPIKSKNVLLKVVDTSPKLVLKILKELPDDEKLEDLFNIVKDIKNPPKLTEKTKISSNTLKNPSNLANELKKIPEKLGIDHEYKILMESTEKINNIKHEAFIKNDINYINFIENFQKLCDYNMFLFPVFFKDDVKYFDYAIINFKKKGSKDEKIFSIAIVLKLKDNTNLKILILQKEKNLSLSISTNNEKFLKIINQNIANLIKSIENNTHFKILNYSIFLDKELNETESLLELIEIDNLKSFINLKA